jgi:ribosome biogenesis protein MAK21
MKSFESLLTLSRKRNREQALTALAALKDLLGVGMVLPERRLKTFTNQSALIGALQQIEGSDWRTSDPLPGTLTKVHLISFAYEDWLKDKYFDMLKILESWCSDEVEYARVRAIGFVSDLLKEKPEQESNLLRLLVNKLGDTDNRIASKASFLLLQLQTTHPLMKNIVISSIESEIILRSGQTSHAKYYAIITLNQTMLSSKEALLADKLLDVYFGILISLLKRASATSANHLVNSKKCRSPHPSIRFEKNRRRNKGRINEGTTTGEEVTEKMISAVLTGVNRAFPFSNNKAMYEFLIMLMTGLMDV